MYSFILIPFSIILINNIFLSSRFFSINKIVISLWRKIKIFSNNFSSPGEKFIRFTFVVNFSIIVVNQSNKFDVYCSRTNYSVREKTEGQEIEMDLPYRITQVYSTSVNQHSPLHCRVCPFPHETNCYGSLTVCCKTAKDNASQQRCRSNHHRTCCHYTLVALILLKGTISRCRLNCLLDYIFVIFLLSVIWRLIVNIWKIYKIR